LCGGRCAAAARRFSDLGPRRHQLTTVARALLLTTGILFSTLRFKTKLSHKLSKGSPKKGGSGAGISQPRVQAPSVPEDLLPRGGRPKPRGRQRGHEVG
jgi:hypothetical protein